MFSYRVDEEMVLRLPEERFAEEGGTKRAGVNPRPDSFCLALYRDSKRRL